MKTAVLIPCHNEELTIQKVVEDFKAALPDAQIFVYDNNSTDSTAERALAAGATVCREKLQGKGNVVRRMFGDIEADVYVLVDGDDTYEAAAAASMVDQLVNDRLDCLNGIRQTDVVDAYRQGHRFGNWLLTTLVARLFGRTTSDMLTGYRVFTRRFVKSFPAVSTGFELETEITVHCLEMRLKVEDYPTRYKERPAGSFSKLKTYRDGVQILSLIVSLVKLEKPFLFFSMIGFAGIFIAVLIFIPVLLEYLESGVVRRFPTAILSASLIIVSLLAITSGIILETVTRGRKEFKRMMYLAADVRPPAD